MLIQKIEDIDTDYVTEYNRKAKPDFQLHLEMGPCPYEGEIESCPIILLLANPGYDKNSKSDDHYFKVEGWPLSGLHETAPPGMRDWWRPRLRVLSEKYGAQFISRNISALQINPWASVNFDSEANLPSQKILIDIAERAAKRGALLLVMRAERLWLQSDIIRNHKYRFSTKSKRCSFVTEGNFGDEAWKNINFALSSAN